MICRLCNSNCCKEFVITITAFDLLRIAQKIKNYEKYIEIRPANLINLQEEFVLEFKEGYGILAIKSHPCIFLKENKCSIWNFAPMSCRLYPFNIEGKKIINAVCPLHASLLFSFTKPQKELLEKAKKENELYKKIVKEWNAKKSTKKEVLPFLIKRAKELAATFNLL